MYMCAHACLCDCLPAVNACSGADLSECPRAYLPTCVHAMCGCVHAWMHMCAGTYLRVHANATSCIASLVGILGNWTEYSSKHGMSDKLLLA